MSILTPQEAVIAKKIKQLKKNSGTHSPSMFTIVEKIPELEIKVDACYLSNPYATQLFLDYLKAELIEPDHIRDVLEFYPSQNEAIAEILASYLQVPYENILIGNGAAELIQGVLHNFTRSKILINIPTFSPYYEFVKKDTQVVYNRLKKENDFKLNVNQYIDVIKKEKPDTIVLINPNNPDGGYVKYDDVISIVKNLEEVKTIIIDESFIHFAFESPEYAVKSISHLVLEYPNLVILKSMSKDFGIAGIRAGYAIMDAKRVTNLLTNGFLWNSNGLAEYFFRLYVRSDFIKAYEKVRMQYIEEAQWFYREIGNISYLKKYPSMANFVLVELLNGVSSDDFFAKMLIKNGVYLRTCSDKIGLEGEFLRIGSRTKKENELILEALMSLEKVKQSG